MILNRLPMNVSGEIYGVEWNKRQSTSLTRTDAAASLSAPSPCLSGGSGSSPFDNIMPWKGMVKETIGNDVFVKIPKFWFKWTDGSKLTLQIANYKAPGFFVSPAHADRGDGKGERKYVYVGRYHCDSNYKSVSGATPITNVDSGTARTGCTGRGTGYYQFDYAMAWTIRMLYLVEFADWNSQGKIGYGGGSNTWQQTTSNTGSSDNAKYHTGTMKSSRTTYGVGIQYRYIEDLWANVFDWCDGFYLSYENISGSAYYPPRVSIKPSEYSDSSKYTKVGNGIKGTNSGVVKSFGVPTISGFEWALYPNACAGLGGSADYNNYYIADEYSPPAASYGMLVPFGGAENETQIGLFTYRCYAISSPIIGCRLQYLP